MRLKYYELHQTPNERQKAKLIFCGGLHDLRPHHHGKKRKDASTDSGLGASAQTLVLRRIKSKYKYNIVSIVDMIRFHYQFRKICFQYCGFNDILTKITSLGDVVFLDFQIGRFEGGGAFINKKWDLPTRGHVSHLTNCSQTTGRGQSK